MCIRDSLSYHNPTRSEVIGSKLFILANGDLYAYDKEDTSIRTYSKSFPLSDTEISYIAYQSVYKSLVIIYSNANIDLLVNEEDIYNLSLIHILHVGHPLGYIASDIYARYKRLQGFNVLNPMGYDAYGLPAEQYAIQTGQHPAITTINNIDRYREQLDKIGFCFDWSREIRTCEPEYYCLLYTSK